MIIRSFRAAFAISLLIAAPTMTTPAQAASRATLKGCTVSTKACLEAVAKSYIDALVSHDGSQVPLAPNVRRTENALTNARGEHEVRESFVRTTMVESIGDLRFYTVPEKGEVVAFFLLNVDLKEADATATTRAGSTDYKVAVTKPAGTYTVHEAERFRIHKGRIEEIEIIAHVEDGKGQGSGWPVERDAAVGKGHK